MAFVCAITGEVPEEPVISMISKNVFEKRVLEKYIQANGKDPITEEPMTLADFISVKSANISPPNYSNQTSIPAILKLLQDEWDSFVLENYERSKTLNSMKEELSVSLFHLDSACRVIARLMSENEELKKTLSQMGSDIKLETKMEIEDHKEEVRQEQDGDILDESIFEEFQIKSKELTNERKKKNKNIPSELADASYISELKQSINKKNLHSSGANSSILSMDLRISDSIIVTGGKDKTAVLYDRNSDKVLTTFKGHTKGVTKVLFHPFEPIVISGSFDNQIRIWKETVGKSQLIIKNHNSSINGISCHPLGIHVLSSSADNTWALTNISNGQTVIKREVKDSVFSCSQIHPDGLIFALGSFSGLIDIFDFRTCSNVVKFTEHTENVSALAFSENGYYFASGSNDSTVRIWDLRKAKCVTELNSLNDKNLTSLSFDETGQYLAIGGQVIRIYACKKWEEITKFEGHTNIATSVKFGKLAKYIVSSSMDGTLNIYTPS